MVDVGAVISRLSKLFECDYDEITFHTEPQIIDGSVVYFSHKTKIIASARMRLRNGYELSKLTGQLHIRAQISDIVQLVDPAPAQKEPGHASHKEPVSASKEPEPVQPAAPAGEGALTVGEDNVGK